VHTERSIKYFATRIHGLTKGVQADRAASRADGPSGPAAHRSRPGAAENRDCLLASVGGALVAQSIAPQARTLAEDRGIRCVVVDDDELHGMPSNHMRLF
jgi:Endonuclease NucS